VNGFSYTFDAENRIKTRTLYQAGSDKYTYDGTGTMLKSENTFSGTWTHYVGGVYEETNTGAVTKYYKWMGETLAVRRSNGAIQYMLKDQLGSTVELLDTNGNTLAEMKYWPYGGIRSGTAGDNELLFTGQRVEGDDVAQLGLYNYGARFYSTVLGRFLSADPLTYDGLNRYTYARNNPLAWIDPTGLMGIAINFAVSLPIQLAAKDAEAHGTTVEKPHGTPINIPVFVARSVKT
jgi:RHS repeat-associated protein